MKYLNWFLYVGLLLVSSATTAHGAISLRDCALSASPAAPEPIVSEASGATYLRLSADGKNVERCDYRSGKLLDTVMSTASLRDCDVKTWDGFSISPTGKYLLLWTGTEKIYRHMFRAYYYVYDISRGNIKPLSNGGKQQAAQFSPDSRMVAFVRDNNIYLAKLDYGTEVAVTTDGKLNEVINGTPDWVYHEEFGMISSITFSPDSQMLAFIKWDEKEVKMYDIQLYRGMCSHKDEYTYYPGQFSYKYPMAGETHSSVKVISYDIDNRQLKQLNVPLDYDGYVCKIEFGNTSDRLMVNTLNRNQTDLRLYAVNPRSAIAKQVYADKTSSWIDPHVTSMTRYYSDSFIVASERDGHCHLYQYSNAGSLMKQVTKGDWDVTDFYGYDPVTMRYYFQSTKNGAINRTVSVYDAKKAVITDLTPSAGWATASFNSTLSYFICNFSDATTPNVYTLCDSKGKNIRTINDNASYKSKWQEAPKKEFFTMQSDGYTLNGYMLKPNDFVPSHKYPVIMYQYSGPQSQLVCNKWNMEWLNYVATQGYIVMCVDGRGTGGRGKDFAALVYKQLGYYETIYQLAAASYAASLPYVDADRIGIFGWSYGGYMTIMAMTEKGNPYKAGVAVAPVTDWRMYDCIYTERFMLSPQQNAIGYDSASTLNRVKNLSGNLLIVSGTADDNVHINNTYEFVSHATEEDVLVDMMIYPNKDHHINGCSMRYSLYKKLLDYFNRNL